MVDVGSLSSESSPITGSVFQAATGWCAPALPAPAQWQLMIWQRWMWRRAGLTEDDLEWVEKMLALAHEGHGHPERCWITYEKLRG